MRYSKAQLERLWIHAGGDPRRAKLMAAIALAESGGQSGIVNSIGATGLWQIHPGGSQYTDPLTNARTAVHKLSSQGLGAWEAYTNGAYRKFLGGGGGGVPAVALSTASPLTRAASGPATPGLRANLLASLISASQQTSHHQQPDYTNVFSAMSALGKGGGSSSSSTPAAGGMSMGSGAQTSTSAKGVVNFEGKPVAAWIAPILRRARQAGWRGTVTSGVRSLAEQTRIYNSGVRPAARPGTSNHEMTGFPGGAVDVTEAEQLDRILRRLGIVSLRWAGAKDRVHFSHPHAGHY